VALSYTAFAPFPALIAFVLVLASSAEQLMSTKEEYADVSVLPFLRSM
jgi:hypothetical protein